MENQFIVIEKILQLYSILYFENHLLRRDPYSFWDIGQRIYDLHNFCYGHSRGELLDFSIQKGPRVFSFMY